MLPVGTFVALNAGAVLLKFPGPFGSVVKLQKANGLLPLANVVYTPLVARACQ